MTLKRTYEITTAPPQPMDWNTYYDEIMKAWVALLNSEGIPESKFQQFLEENPSFLPHGLGGHHSPLYGAIFSKPLLAGYQSKIPDFMWIEKDSEKITAVLIEIETPYKKWFTKHDVQTAAFSQAHNQLQDWKVWFSKPENVINFKKQYRIIDSDLNVRNFQQKYVLIYGRRGKDSMNAKRAMLKATDEELMTYDRLHPAKDLDNVVTLKVNAKGEFNLLAIPPTLLLGPHLADDFAVFLNRDNAINSNQLISVERKKFLIKRLAYWDEWAKNKPHGWVCNGDRE